MEPPSIMKSNHVYSKIPSYLASLDEKLGRFIVDVPTKTLFTTDGHRIAETLTRELPMSLNLLRALTQLPPNEYTVLAKHHEQVAINTTVLLEPALFYLRSQVEHGSQRAKQEVRKLHQFIKDQLATISPELLDGFVRAAKEAEFSLPSSVIEAHHKAIRKTISAEGDKALQNPGHIPSPDAMVEEFIAQGPKGATCYDLYDMFNSSLGGNIPPEILGPMVFCFLSSSLEIGQAIGLLFLLHEDSKTRQESANGFIHAYPNLTLTELNRSRLHQILLWLPETERREIVTALSLDLSKPPAKITLPSTLFESHALFCDGAGCYGSVLLLKTEQGYQSAHVLMKEGYGVKDAFLSPPNTKKYTQTQVNECIEAMSEHGLTEECVNRDVLTLQWQHFIAEGQEQKRVPLAGLLAISELIDNTYWQPKKVFVMSVQTQLANYQPKNKTLALKNTARWLDEEGLVEVESWFESNEKLHQLTTRAKREKWENKKLIDRIMNTILLPKREHWQTRFALCALILLHSKDKKLLTVPLGQFYLLLEAASTDDGFIRIPLMQAVARYSKEMSEARSEHEGPTLEIL